MIAAGGEADAFERIGSVSIDSAGNIVFTAITENLPGGISLTGIFTGPDAETDRVIGDGDPLFGSTSLGSTAGSAALNDRGEIAFHYGLQSARDSGIAVATPVP